MTYVCYVHSTKDGIPFYVGAGCKGRETIYGNRSREWKKERDLNGLVVTVFVFSSLTEAHAKEVELISKYKRRADGGTLINKSTGGPGATSGIKKNPEWRGKLSKSLLGHSVPPEVRSAISKSLMGNTINKGRVHSEQSKRNMSMGHQKRKLNLNTTNL